MYKRIYRYFHKSIYCSFKEAGVDVAVAVFLATRPDLQGELFKTHTFASLFQYVMEIHNVLLFLLCVFFLEKKCLWLFSCV